MKAKVTIIESKKTGMLTVFWPNPIPGKSRCRRRFKTKVGAGNFADEKRTALLNGGVKASGFRDEAVREAIWAHEQLTAHGVSIREVVEGYLRSRETITKSIPAADAVEDMLDAKRTDGMSVRYVASLQARLRKFAKAFGKRLLAEIKTPEISAWLRSIKGAAETRNTMRRHLVVLYSWAIESGFAETNPALKATKAKVPKHVAPEIFTPAETRIIMEAAPVELKPYFALGFFGGIRSQEIERLDWRNVDFLLGHIEIDAATSKTAAHRLVTMNDTLRAWLQPHAKAAGPVRPANCKRRLLAFRSNLAEKDGDRPAVPWKDNGPRHSYGSYSMAKVKDAGKVASEMGHTSPATTFKHYRQRVTAEAAAEFFAVRPDGAESRIVNLNQRTA